MRTCAAWLLKHASIPPALPSLQRTPPVFVSGRCSLTPILQPPGRGFLERTRFSTLIASAMTLLLPGAARRNVLWKVRKNWSLTRLKRCSPWVIINSECCVITDLPKPRSVASANSYQAAATCQGPSAESLVTRDTGMKALLTTSELSPQTHIMWTYSWRQHGLTLCVDSSQPPLSSTIEGWTLRQTIPL